MPTPLPIEAYLTYRHLLRLQLSLQLEYEAHERPNAFCSVPAFVALETLLANLRLKLQGLTIRSPCMSNAPPTSSPSVPLPNALSATAAAVASTPPAPATSLSPAVPPNFVPNASLPLSDTLLQPTDSVLNTTASKGSDLACDTASAEEEANNGTSPKYCTFAAHVEELLGQALPALPPMRVRAAVATSTSMGAMGTEASAEVSTEQQQEAAAAKTREKLVPIDTSAAPAVIDMIASFNRMSCAETERQRDLEKEREKKRHAPALKTSGAQAQAQATTSSAQSGAQSGAQPIGSENEDTSASASATAVSCTNSNNLQGAGAEEAANDSDSASATWTQPGPAEKRESGESGEGAQGASAEPGDVNESQCEFGLPLYINALGE